MVTHASIVRKIASNVSLKLVNVKSVPRHLACLKRITVCVRAARGHFSKKKWVNAPHAWPIAMVVSIDQSVSLAVKGTS